MSNKQRCLRFVVAWSAVLLVWLLVLPAIGRLAPVEDMIERNQQYGIDPSALFYTELDGFVRSPVRWKRAADSDAYVERTVEMKRP